MTEGCTIQHLSCLISRPIDWILFFLTLRKWSCLPSLLNSGQLIISVGLNANKTKKARGLCLVLQRDVRYSFPFVLIVRELCWQKHFAHEIRGMEGEGKATLIVLRDVHVAWQIEQVEEVGSGFLTSQLIYWFSQFNWLTLWHRVPWALQYAHP